MTKVASAYRIGDGSSPPTNGQCQSFMCDCRGVIIVSDMSLNVQLPVQDAMLATVKSVMLKMSTDASSAIMAIL